MSSTISKYSCPRLKSQYTGKKRCQSKPIRFRGILRHTLGYRTKIRNLSKSFVISQVSYETLPGFAAERVSYQTSQRYRGQKVSYETVFFLISSIKETTVHQTELRHIKTFLSSPLYHSVCNPVSIFHYYFGLHNFPCRTISGKQQTLKNPFPWKPIGIWKLLEVSR